MITLREVDIGKVLTYPNYSRAEKHMTSEVWQITREGLTNNSVVISLLDNCYELLRWGNRRKAKDGRDL